MQHPNSSQVLRSDSLCKSVLRPRDNTRDKVDGTLQVAGGDDFSVALSCASSVAPAPIAPTKFRNIAHIWAHCLSDKKYQEMIIVYHCYCVCAIRLLYLNHCLRSWSPLQLLRLKLWTDCFSPRAPRAPTVQARCLPHSMWRAPWTGQPQHRMTPTSCEHFKSTSCPKGILFKYWSSKGARIEYALEVNLC